jgi:hypothetical protein
VHFISTPKKKFYQNKFRVKILFKSAKIALVLVYLVILPVFVRLTGSGMVVQIGQNALAITYLNRKNCFYSTKGI